MLEIRPSILFKRIVHPEHLLQDDFLLFFLLFHFFSNHLQLLLGSPHQTGLHHLHPLSPLPLTRAPPSHRALCLYLPGSLTAQRPPQTPERRPPAHPERCRGNPASTPPPPPAQFPPRELDEVLLRSAASSSALCAPSLNLSLLCFYPSSLHVLSLSSSDPTNTSRSLNFLLRWTQTLSLSLAQRWSQTTTCQLLALLHTEIRPNLLKEGLPLRYQRLR